MSTEIDFTVSHTNYYIECQLPNILHTIVSLFSKNSINEHAFNELIFYYECG